MNSSAERAETDALLMARIVEHFEAGAITTVTDVAGDLGLDRATSEAALRRLELRELITVDRGAPRRIGSTDVDMPVRPTAAGLDA